MNQWLNGDDLRISDIAKRQAEGMRAISKEEMARRQLEDASVAYNMEGLDHMRGQAAMNNFYRDVVDVAKGDPPITKKPTIAQRIARWFKK